MPALDDVWDAFGRALAAVGLHASLPRRVTGGAGWDAGGSIETVPTVVEVRAVPTVGDAAQLARRDAPANAYKIVAARRVSESVRAALIDLDIGYFDARGHLRLWRKPLFVDTDVPPMSDLPTRRRLRLTPAGLDVALAVLDGYATRGVRATADLLARSPGTVSKLLAELREHHLVDDRAQPTIPDLFEMVADEWNPERVPLAGRPREGTGKVNERLEIRLDDTTAPGWVLADALAAVAWGAPIVVSSSAPPDFYVPDSRILREARTLLGAAPFGQHECTVAVAPAPFVCRRRYDRAPSGRHRHLVFLAPSPVVAALDLARDPARGREVLELWSRDLPPDVHRVW